MSRESRARRAGAVLLTAVGCLVAVFVPAGSTSGAVSPGAGEPRWSWPVPAPIRVVKAFAAPASAYTAGHRGIDLAAVPEAAVMAPMDATVWFSGPVVDRPVLTLAVGDDVLVSFEPVAATVSVGDRVARGEVVGSVASGGHCEGCVHVGVRVDGAYVSPLLFFDRVPRAILFPMDGSAPLAVGGARQARGWAVR